MEWMIAGVIVSYVAAIVAIIVLSFFYRDAQNQEKKTREKLKACADEAEKLKQMVPNQEKKIGELASKIAVLTERNEQLKRLEQYEIHLSESEARLKVKHNFLPHIKRILAFNYSEQSEELSFDIEVASKGSISETVQSALMIIQAGITPMQRYELAFIRIGVIIPMRDNFGKLWHVPVLRLSFDRPTIRKIDWDYVTADGLFKVATTAWRYEEKTDSDNMFFDDDEMDAMEMESGDDEEINLV